jgi:cytoskeletal protein RodZ
MLGVDNNGNDISGDRNAIRQVVSSVYSPTSFPLGSTVRVEVIKPSIGNLTSFITTYPLTLKYTWNGNQNNVGNKFRLTEPAATATGNTDEFSGTANIQATTTPAGSIKFAVESRSILIFTNNAGFWE